jgi:hypothetical protein
MLTKAYDSGMSGLSAAMWPEGKAIVAGGAPARDASTSTSPFIIRFVILSGAPAIPMDAFCAVPDGTRGNLMRTFFPALTCWATLVPPFGLQTALKLRLIACPERSRRGHPNLTGPPGSGRIVDAPPLVRVLRTGAALSAAEGWVRDPSSNQGPPSRQRREGRGTQGRASHPRCHIFFRGPKRTIRSCGVSP